MTKLVELINCIKTLSIDAVSTMLDAVNILLVSSIINIKPGMHV